jgi:DNA-directed RNA polymerase beta' subunit
MNKFNQVEVLRILNKHSDVTLNENKYGVHINLSELKKEILDELNMYIKYVNTQELTLNKIEKQFSGINRFDEVREQTKKYKEKDLKESSACPHCGSHAIKKVDRQENTMTIAPLALEAKLYDETAAAIPLQPEMVLRCFQRMTDRHIELIGFNPKFSRPDWMICTVLAVPPLSVRPSVIDDNQRMEDDLTHMLINIVRYNQKLRSLIDKGDSRDTIDKMTGLLQHAIATYVDNDISGMAQSIQRSGRPLKTLKSRLGAKTGRVRGNLMGKRVDFSARSVITPDPNIDLDELGVPEGAGLAGVPVSVYALAAPLNVTGPPPITTFCVTGTGIAVHVIVHVGVINVFPVIVSVIAQ